METNGNGDREMENEQRHQGRSEPRGGVMDVSHLIALQAGLAHERERLVNAKSEQERAARAVWVAGYENEIAAEKKFLGLEDITFADIPDDDDELLAELMS